MRRLGVGAAFALAACASSAPPPSTPVEAVAPATDECARTACREPRTLRVMIDQTHVWEGPLPPTPYVRKNVVSVFPGDDFFLTADEKDGALFNLRFVPPPTGQPQNVLHVQLVQEQLDKAATGGARVMLLTVESSFARPLVYKALVHPPSAPKNVFHGTSTCPLTPGVQSIEMWPDPLTAMMLLNFRLAEQGGVCKVY